MSDSSHQVYIRQLGYFDLNGGPIRLKHITQTYVKVKQTCGTWKKVEIDSSDKDNLIYFIDKFNEQCVELAKQKKDLAEAKEKADKDEELEELLKKRSEYSACLTNFKAYFELSFTLKDDNHCGYLRYVHRQLTACDLEIAIKKLQNELKVKPVCSVQFNVSVYNQHYALRRLLDIAADCGDKFDDTFEEKCDTLLKKSKQLFDAIDSLKD